MTATELPGRRIVWPEPADRRRRCSTRTRCARRGRARRGRAARRRHRAVHRAARRRTSSSSREPGSEDRIWWGDGQPAARPRSTSTACARRSSRTSATQRRSTSSTRSRAPTRSTASACASSPRTPYHALFAQTMFIDADRRGARAASSPRRSSCTRPASRPTPTRTARAPAPSSCCTRRRTEVLIGGTFYAGEIKKSIFTRDERPAAARGRLPDALLGERRRRRRRRDLLRPLGHRQDDAVGRSASAS